MCAGILNRYADRLINCVKTFNNTALNILRKNYVSLENVFIIIFINLDRFVSNLHSYYYW